MTPKAKTSKVRISVLGAKGVGKTGATVLANLHNDVSGEKILSAGLVCSLREAKIHQARKEELVRGSCVPLKYYDHFGQKVTPYDPGSPEAVCAACITRLMYDKFFHDPHHHAKEVHHRTLGIADESFELEIHEEHKVSLEQCSHTHSFENADALLVVYSIVSRRSFDQAAELVTSLEQRCPETPLLLVANCCDLNYKREVETEEGREVSSDFVEVSAAQEGSTDLQSALETLLRRVAAIRELGQHKRRRSISNVLESIFAWNSRGSFSISV